MVRTLFVGNVIKVLSNVSNYIFDFFTWCVFSFLDLDADIGVKGLAGHALEAAALALQQLDADEADGRHGCLVASRGRSLFALTIKAPFFLYLPTNKAKLLKNCTKQFSELE